MLAIPIESGETKVPLHYFEAHNGLWYLATRTEDGRLEWATMPIEPVAADMPIAERDVPDFIRKEARRDLRR